MRCSAGRFATASPLTRPAVTTERTIVDGSRVLADLEKETAAYAAGGFGILKMKVGLLSVEQDAERVAVVRHAVGKNIKLLADANHAYNAATAIRMGRELEKHGVLWFEEPVIPEDRLGYRKVRDALAIPIAGGECEYTRYGFRDLFVGQCIDIALSPSRKSGSRAANR